MAELKFTVTTDLVIGGRVCQPSSVVQCPAKFTPSLAGPAKLTQAPAGPAKLTQAPAGPAKQTGRKQQQQLSEVLAEPDSILASGPSPNSSGGLAKAGDITGFYLAAWVGANSQEFSLCPIAEDGTATVRLTVRPGDVDTVKFAVAFGLATPKSVRCCHLASNYVRREDLLASLGGAPTDQLCLTLCDNFTRNTALLKIVDAGSQAQAYAKLSLKPSSLLKLDDTNEAVKRLGENVERVVGACAISPLNAGTQFVQSFTFGHLSGHLLHYALLGHVFDSIKSPVSLPLVMYNLVSAMHSTNLSFEAIRAIPDEELPPRLGNRIAMSHPSCGLTSIYCPDMTVAPTGQACKVRETEDIARSLSRLTFEVQNYGKPRAYARPPQQGPVSLARAVQSVVEDQARLAVEGETFASRRMSMSLNSDDCENTAQLGMLVFKGIEAACAGSRSAQDLAGKMAREAKLAPATFAQCTDAHFGQMAEVVWRLGKMIQDGRWSMTLAVVSAKGPSYTEDNPNAAEGLCGHGACISRVRNAATGLYQHYPVEGTTYLTVDMPPPKGYATQLPLKLKDGEVQPFPLETVVTLLAQRIHELVGLSAHAQVLAHLKSDYGSSPMSCPFYVSTFFTGLSEGSTGSVGCIPLDTCPPESFNAGAKPVFGAFLMALSDPATMAVPITNEMFERDAGKSLANQARAAQRGGKSLAHKAGAAQEQQDDHLQSMKAQVNEAYSPGISEQRIRDYMTFLQPLKSPDAPALTSKTYAASIRSENTWAFDDPQVTAQAVQIYSALAERFNVLQAKDPESDGATASAYGNYLSACLGISLPVPKDKAKFSLSTTRNLTRAANDIGLVSAVAACLLKTSMINARAAVETKHHFYMCDKGEGIVHAHRTKIATT